MAVFAIADLHLGHSVNKPMGVFGPDWHNHEQTIQANWTSRVGPEDLVLLPGDISWAMTLAEVKEDLAYIGQLPGTKVMIRGNHDYWWSGIGKVRQNLPASLYALQNDAVTFEGITLCGSRGWILPAHPRFKEEDATIFAREISRLKMSLESAATYGNPLIAMMHYPPLGSEGLTTPFTELLTSFGVQTCVYGHLHGPAHRYGFEGMLDGVNYVLVSADFIQFSPLMIRN